MTAAIPTSSVSTAEASETAIFCRTVIAATCLRAGSGASALGVGKLLQQRVPGRGRPLPASRFPRPASRAPLPAPRFPLPVRLVYFDGSAHHLTVWRRAVIRSSFSLRPRPAARHAAIVGLFAILVPSGGGAQQQRPRPRPPTGPVRPYTVPAPGASALMDSVALTGVRWRELGPFRGGRSVAVTGNPQRPNEFWQGTTGGGVFKSVNGGESWAPVTDRYFGGTIGAVEVAPSAPDVVYVGGGEYPIRGNVTHGDGVWKTVDGGKTWAYIGLKETKHIGDIVIHPTNPDLVYVGALGHVWAPNPERGVFRSRDGGRTWQKILFRNDSTGVVDLAMDPNNPSVLYAGFWQAGRTPWMLSSGGSGSGLFKTTDGGDTWKEITRNPGLPEGIWGNIGVT